MTVQVQQTPEPSGRRLSSALADAGRMMRPMAFLALLAMLLAQAVAPALKGVSLGLGGVIDKLDTVTGFTSHLLALATSALCIGLLLLIGRDARIRLPSRVLLIALTTCILVLGVPASRGRLPVTALFLLGLAASSAAMIGAAEGLRQPRSRAVALVLGLMGLAGATRVIGAGLVALSRVGPERFSGVAKALSTVSLCMQCAALLVALLWLASRTKKIASFPTLAAAALAFSTVWASSQGSQPHASPWLVFVSRAVGQLIPLPVSSLPYLGTFAVVLGPALAVVTLTTPRQMHAVVGALALTLTAGSLVDVPGHALILALAALSVTLASRDERGMWEAITGERLAEATPTPPAVPDAPAGPTSPQDPPTS